MNRSFCNKHQRFTDEEEEEDEELLLSQACSRSSDWVVEKPLVAGKKTNDDTVRGHLKTETASIEPFSSMDEIERTLLTVKKDRHNNNHDEFKDEGEGSVEPSPTSLSEFENGSRFSLLKAVEAQVVVQQADTEGHIQEHLHLDVDKMAAQVHEELMHRAELFSLDASTDGSVGSGVMSTRKRRIFFCVVPAVLVALLVAIVVVVVVVVFVAPKDKKTDTSGKCSLCASGTIPLNLDTNKIDESRTCLSFMAGQVTFDATTPQCQQGQALGWMFCDCPTLPSPNRDNSACEFCPDGVLPVGQDCVNLNNAVALVGSSQFMTCDDAIAAAVSSNCTCPNLDALEGFSRLLRPISGDAISDSTSPQFQALNWIANVDLAGLSVEQESHEVIRQRYVAAVLYFSLGGESWVDQHNFLSADHACLWNEDENGLGCNELDETTWVRLPDNNLQGVIPNQIGYFSNLASIDLQMNAVTGTIPEAVSGLVSLDEMDLSDNALTGAIPSALFHLPQLRLIDLSLNEISGQLSASVQNETKLESLLLRGNELSGTIPSAFGRSTVLRHLNLDSNRFTGAIPEFSPFSAVEQILVGVNNLVGTIPASVGSLRQLQVLSVGDNDLDGPIPDFSANEGNLAVLELWTNRFNGTLDRFFTTTPPQSLTYIRVEDNVLTGTISSAIGRFQNLWELRLSQNKLDGTIPTHLGRLTNMSTVIYLWGNNLNGTIPSELGLLTKLENGLILAVNQLTGTVPTHLGSLTLLKELALNQNFLTGIVPTELGNCQNLLRLWVPENYLLGNLNVLLNGLPRTLRELALNDNLFTGTIPTTIGDLVDLEQVAVLSNQLVGSLPSEIGRLTNLTELQLNNNFLNGTIPATLGNCVLLKFLGLGKNSFVGTVPTHLARLSSLEHLYVFGNALNGSIDALCKKPFDVLAANSCAVNNTLECICCTHCCYPDFSSCEEL